MVEPTNLFVQDSNIYNGSFSIKRKNSISDSPILDSEDQPSVIVDVPKLSKTNSFYNNLNCKQSSDCYFNSLSQNTNATPSSFHSDTYSSVLTQTNSLDSISCKNKKKKRKVPEPELLLEGEPNYSEMSMEELTAIAYNYGMKLKLQKKVYVEKFKEIWRYLKEIE